MCCLSWLFSRRLVSEIPLTPAQTFTKSVGEAPPYVTCRPTSYPGAEGVCVPYQQEVDSWDIQNYLGGLQGDGLSSGSSDDADVAVGMRV